MRAATVSDFLPILLQAVNEKRVKFERACNYLADLHLLERAHFATQPSLLAASVFLTTSLLFAAFYGPVEEDILSRSWSPLSEMTDYTLSQVNAHSENRNMSCSHFIDQINLGKVAQIKLDKYDLLPIPPCLNVSNKRPVPWMHNYRPFFSL